MPISSDAPDFVEALARGLSVIRCFGPGAEALTLSQVAQKVDLSRGTARRLLLTLETLGYVVHDGRVFRLTPRVLNLGYAYLSALPLWEVAQPVMRRVVEELDQSCALGALDGFDVVYIARTPPSHLAYLPVAPGTRMPAHINAMGLVLLAQLDEREINNYFAFAKLDQVTKHTMTDELEIRKEIARARRDGFAVSDRQLNIGIRAIAVPVPSRSGRSEIAINASGDESRVTRATLVDRYLPVLRKAADQLALIT